MTTTRDRHQTIRQRVRDAREAVHAAKDRRDAFRERGDEDAAAIAQRQLEDAEANLDVQRELEVQSLAQISGSHGPANLLATDPNAPQITRQVATSSDQLRTSVQVGHLMGPDEARQWTGRALAAAGDPPDIPSDAGPRQFGGVIPAPQAPTDLLDLFVTVPVTGRIASFLRRTTPLAAAGIQVPGALKAPAGLNYEPVDFEFPTVAGWQKVRRQDVEDFDGFIADAQSAMEYGLRRQVELLLVNGDEEHSVPGILSSDGVLEPDVDAIDAAADKIARALAELRLSGVAPSFVALNPLDYVELATAKSEGSGEYVSATYLADGRVWQVPCVQSVALEAGTALAGDSRIGAKLLFRADTGVAVRISDQDQDDGIRNQLTIVVEGRFGPAPTVPAAFASFDLGTAPEPPGTP